VTRKARFHRWGHALPFKAILLEVDHLNGVSARLEGLAEQHPPGV